MTGRGASRNAMGQRCSRQEGTSLHALDPWNKSVRQLVLDLALTYPFFLVEPYASARYPAGRPPLRVGGPVASVSSGPPDGDVAPLAAYTLLPDVGGGDREVGSPVPTAPDGNARPH